MSLLCIGANHDGVDVSQTFINSGLVWLDWTEYPELDRMLEKATTGTMIAIKSWHPTKGLTIKAVGVLKNSCYADRGFDRDCREVKWLSTQSRFFERINDKWDNIRNGSIYMEPNEQLIADIIALIP